MSSQYEEEAAARRAAAAKQETQSTPAPGERRAGVVPTSGPDVSAENYVGQQPYTQPPPLGLRRFYEDPQPPDAASEQQVLQGRGAPPPYPPLEPPARSWQPRRYADQMDTPRPADSPQPSEYEANATLTLAQFLALPQEQQDTILEQARAQQAIGRTPEFVSTREIIEEADRRLAEGEKLRQEAQQQRLQQQQQTGVPRMAPPPDATLTAGDVQPEPDPA